MKQMSQFTLFQLMVAQSVTVNDIVRSFGKILQQMCVPIYSLKPIL